MRKVHLILLYLFFFFLWIFLSINEIIPDGYRTYVLLFLVLSFFQLVNIEYFSEQPNGFANWVNPILKLSVLLIKLDGVERISETKRIIKYLHQHFDPITVKYKMRYFRKEYSQKQDFKYLCQEIKEASGSIEKIRVLQHLIRLALSDRLLTDNERKFIQRVADILVIPKHTLEALYAMHTFVTEEDIKNQQSVKPRVNRSIEKSYSVLGLKSEATFEEVKEAYRELAKVFHPDKQRGGKKSKEIAKAQFQIISNAYNLIKENNN